MIKFYSLLNQVFASGFSFVVIILSARLLNTSEFGVISLIIMSSLLISVISQSFINMPIMSNALKRSLGDRERYLYDSFILQIVLVFFIVLIFSLFYYFNFFNMQAYFGFIAIIVYFATFQIYEFLKKILFIENNHKLVTSLEIVKFIFMLIGFIIVYFSDINLDISQVLYIISFSYILFILFSFSYIKFTTFNKKRFQHLVIENYFFGKWIFLSNIIQNLNSNLYIYVSAFLLPLSVIGALNAIRSLIGFSTVIFLALDNYLTPKFSQLFLDLSIKDLTVKINKIYNKIGILLILVYMIMALYSGEIIRLVYGENFIEYSYFMYVFLLANMVMFYTRPILILVKTISLTKIMFLASIPTFIVTLVGVYPFIYFGGVDGALFMMLFVQLAYLISLKYFYNKEVKNG